MKRLNISNTEMVSILIGGLIQCLIGIGLNMISQDDLNNQIDEKIEEKFNKEAAKNKEET